MNKMDYKYCKIPVNLMYLLDSDCYKAISLLIQQESYWKNKNQLKDGFFYKSVGELAKCFRAKNMQDVRLILQTLQENNLIEIKTSKGGRTSNHYRINWESINALSAKTIQETLNDEMIKTKKRGKKNKNIDSYDSKKIDSTISYQSENSNSTIPYYLNQCEIVQDCTTTNNNIIINNKNNITNNNNTYSTMSLIDNETECSIICPSKLKYLFPNTSSVLNFKLRYNKIIDYLKSCGEDEYSTVLGCLVDWLPIQNELGNIPYNYIQKYMCEAKQAAANRFS